MTVVTAALLMKENKILIAKRGPEDKLANKWEFPGGKIEGNETPQECLRREMKEEFQIDIAVGEFFATSTYSYEHISIELLAYWASWVGGEFNPIVHDEIKWVPLFELDYYDFAPADIPFVNRLKEMNNSEKIF